MKFADNLSKTIYEFLPQRAQDDIASILTFRDDWYGVYDIFGALWFELDDDGAMHVSLMYNRPKQ